MQFPTSLLGFLGLLCNLCFLISRNTQYHNNRFLIWVTYVRNAPLLPKSFPGLKVREELAQFTRLLDFLNYVQSGKQKNQNKKTNPLSKGDKKKGAHAPSSPPPPPPPSFFFSLSKFRRQRDQNLFFGSGYVPLKTLSSTSHKNVLVQACDPKRFPTTHLVLRILEEDQAKKYSQLYDLLDGFLHMNNTSGSWLPMYEREPLGMKNKKLVHAMGSPHYPTNVKEYLSTRTLDSVECKQITLFLLAMGLKLHEVQIGFGENKFSFDYVFLKDASQGIRFDNLVLGGYHAMTIFDTASTTPLHPMFFLFADQVISMIRQLCLQPVKYNLWVFPFVASKHHLTTVSEAHMIFSMIATGLVLAPCWRGWTWVSCW